MPWSAADATRHTKKAKSGKQKRQWSEVANSAMQRGLSEGAAIREANAVVARGKKHGKKKKRFSRHLSRRRFHSLRRMQGES